MIAPVLLKIKNQMIAVAHVVSVRFTEQISTPQGEVSHLQVVLAQGRELNFYGADATALWEKFGQYALDVTVS